jgi:hypothetical protein
LSEGERGHDLVLRATPGRLCFGPRESAD